VPDDTAFLRRIVDDNDALIRALLFLAGVLALLLAVSVCVATWVLPRVRPRITVAKDGTTNITFDAPNERIRYASLLIHPQGWNETDFWVRTGDTITINASGRVNISLGGLLRDLTAVEKRLDELDSVYKRRRQPVPESLVPDSAGLRYPWIGPQGFRTNSWLDTARTAILPTARRGQLILVITPRGSPAEYWEQGDTAISQLAPYDGPNTRIPVARGGRVYFILNDTQFYHPRRRFWNWVDNLGFFAVSLRIDGSN